MTKKTNIRIDKPDSIGSLTIHHIDSNGMENELAIQINQIGVSKNDGCDGEVFKGTRTGLKPAREKYTSPVSGKVYAMKTPYKVIGNSVIDPANIIRIDFNPVDPNQALSLVDTDNLFGEDSKDD